MKLRVRTVHGETLKVEADKTDSIASFIAKLDLPPALAPRQGDLCLSLNKKDMLIPESTLEANGIRGGDLVHLLLRNGSEVPCASSSRPQASSSATIAGSGTPSPPPAPPRSNLYGLPTTAPTSDTGRSAGAAGLVQDSAGRVWQESVIATSKPQGATDPEEARRQRLLAIERRLGKSAVDEPEPVSVTQKRERPEGFAGDPGAVRSKQPPTCHDMLRTLHQRNNLGLLSATDAWVLGLHCSIAKCGYQSAHGEDSFLTQAWKGKSGSYTLSYLAEVEGCKAELTLKCVEMGAEIIVHASLGQGHTARANMRCAVSEMATSRQGGGLPELAQGGEPLFQMVRAKLIAALERQGVSARNEAGGGGASSAPPKAGSGDAEMTELDCGTIAGAGFPGLVDQAQTFAVFREGLRVAKSLPEVQATMLHEASFLVLSVHVLMCCAGLSPERDSSAAAPTQSAPEADSCACINPEWELVEGGAGQADWELVDKDSEHEERSQKRPGPPGGAAAAGECKWLLPEALRNSIAALPENWQRPAHGGSHAVRYVASVEGGSATVLFKAVQLNGRLFLHARIVAPPKASRGAHHFSAAPTARCVLVQSQMVAKIGGECVVTDEALEQLIVLVSRRLLVPIGRAVRAASALLAASPGDDDKAVAGVGESTHMALSARQGAASGMGASEAGEEPVGGVRAAGGGGAHPGSRAPRASFGALYAELKTHVLAHLPGRVLGVVSCASRKLNSLAMNDLLWGFLVVRDFGKGFGAAPLPVKDGGDQTWRGTYRALLHKRQQRRSAVRQLLRIPFPLNPLAPWLPHTPGQARLPPHNDARFPLPWMVPVPMPWGSGTGSWGLGGNTLPIDNGPLSDGIRSYSVSRPTTGANVASERDQLRHLRESRAVLPREAGREGLPEAGAGLPSPPRPANPLAGPSSPQLPRPLLGVGAARGGGGGGGGGTGFFSGAFRGF